MTTVSMFEAKTNLSRYVASVVSQQEPYIVITRNGKPVAMQGEGRVLESSLPGSVSPLQIPRTGTRVYAFDELCWYVKENITALDRDFFDERLFGWLDDLSGNDRFSESLRRMKEEGRPMSDLVRFLFGASDYITPAEQKEVAAALAVLDKQDAAARAGMIADYYYLFWSEKQVSLHDFENHYNSISTWQPTKRPWLHRKANRADQVNQTTLE